MKTIAELNQKIWYRFLKVLYILVFIPVFIVPVLLIGTFGGSLLSLLIVYVLFAMGQRLFYYIVLGSFIPPKQKAVD
jgi:hypothetical protein